MTKATKLLFMLTGASLMFSACSNTTPKVRQPVKKEVQPVKKYTPPPPPKKKIELKEVQDDNYSPEYMYPEDKYKKDKLVEEKPTVSTETPVETAAPAMSREECISMIGQEKFDKYTEMFGNEAASIKRCTLLKSMQKS
jgi:hypothetical protein